MCCGEVGMSAQNANKMAVREHRLYAAIRKMLGERCCRVSRVEHGHDASPVIEKTEQNATVSRLTSWHLTIVITAR